MPDLSAAAAHLHQRAERKRAYVRRSQGWLSFYEVAKMQAEAAEDDAWAGLLGAIDAPLDRIGGRNLWEWINAITDQAGAVAAVVVPEEKR